MLPKSTDLVTFTDELLMKNLQFFAMEEERPRLNPRTTKLRLEKPY